MEKQATVLYSTTVEKITSFLESEISEVFNVVGVCTDEFVLGKEEINGIPFVQINDVNSPVVLLDDYMPDTFRKVLSEKGLTTWDVEHYLREANENCPNSSFDEADPNAKTNDADSSDESCEESGEIFSELLDQKETNQQVQTSLCFSDEQAEEMRLCLTTWLNKIFQAVNNTKSKDVSIYNINKELQKYKDGYYWKITSPIVSEIITLREDFKKSIEDCSKFGSNHEKQVNYLDCTIDQIGEILDNYDVKVADGCFTYNGRIIFPTTNTEATGNALFENEYPEIEKGTHLFTEDANEVKDCASLELFLSRVASSIESLLQDNEALIKSIEIQNSDLKKQNAVTDGLVIIPLLRKIIRMKLVFLENLEKLKNSSGDSEDIYKEAYEYGIMCADKILSTIGVNIRNNIDDIYDPKYHRIIKMQKITPEESEKDKHISAFVTDCYVNEERVVAPAKVVVYKL